MAESRIPKGLNPQQWASIVHGLELQPTTINDYRKVLNLLHTYNNGQYHILSMNKEDALNYYNYLDARVQDHSLSANTAHRYKATLRSLGTRIDQQAEQFPNYQNPFTQLVKNEYRKRTSYETVSFADAASIDKIRKQYYTLHTQEAFIIELMINLGLTPRQIEQIRLCDFKDTDKGLCLSIPDGNDAVATYMFFGPFANDLKKYYSDLGHSDSTQNLFLTSRHLPYSYRAVHHVVQTISQEAGLEEPVTPYQLSLYGMIHSYLLDASVREHAQLDQQLTTTSDPETMHRIHQEINRLESVFIPLAKKSWLGNWQNHYPYTMQKQIDAMMDQLGIEKILHIVGL